MKRLEFGKLCRYDAVRLVVELEKLDRALTAPASIQLCGSASVLLQSVDFRETMDIDFCKQPDDIILKTVEAIGFDRHLFDTNASGIIGLLIDYEDRLVRVNLGFKSLEVLCLSTRDWIVSKLASPKIDDVLDRADVTPEDLHWVEENMYLYGGVSTDRAHSDLRMLIREFDKR